MGSFRGELHEADFDCWSSSARSRRGSGFGRRSSTCRRTAAAGAGRLHSSPAVCSAGPASISASTAARVVGQCNWTSIRWRRNRVIQTSSFLIGGTLGGNYQFGAFVIGLEGDGDWNNARRQNYQRAWPAVANQENLAGHRPWPRGLGLGSHFVLRNGRRRFRQCSSRAGSAWPFDSVTQTGWTAGAGVEWAFLPNWTAKVEYLYVDLGNLGLSSGRLRPFAATPGAGSVNLV